MFHWDMLICRRHVIHIAQGTSYSVWKLSDTDVGQVFVSHWLAEQYCENYSY